MKPKNIRKNVKGWDGKSTLTIPYPSSKLKKKDIDLLGKLYYTISLIEEIDKVFTQCNDKLNENGGK